MHSSLAQTVTVWLDLLFSVVVWALFLRPSLRRNYPWMFGYLSVRAVTGVLVGFLLYGPLLASPELYTEAYFLLHWISYVVSAVLLFLGCLDVYRQALAPLRGLVRMGTTLFRWAAIASVLVTATTFTSITQGDGVLVKIGILLMRCVGTTELCLLALLMLSMRAIGLSPRSRPFGIALGLATLALVDCAESSVAVLHVSVNPSVQSIFEGATLVALGLWTLYAALPEPVAKQLTVRADSAIYKWDQIAVALGHKGTQVALQPATQSFFLVDVEKVVERAFVRTLKNKESES
jgi:hypothetical protein